MTREEAKKNLVAYMYYAIDDLPEDVGKAIDMAIKALEGKDTNVPTKWIPVSERLPKKKTEVLATTVWKDVTIATMYSANDWLIHEGSANAEADEILAWMPLPEPYRAESEGK